MTQISGRSGGGMSELTEPAPQVGGTNASKITREPEASPMSEAALKVAEASFKAVDERRDVASESNQKASKRTVGARSQGIPQALGEQGENEGALTPAAIAAQIGRVRI